MIFLISYYYILVFAIFRYKLDNEVGYYISSIKTQKDIELLSLCLLISNNSLYLWYKNSLIETVCFNIRTLVGLGFAKYSSKHFFFLIDRSICTDSHIGKNPTTSVHFLLRLSFPEELHKFYSQTEVDLIINVQFILINKSNI